MWYLVISLVLLAFIPGLAFGLEITATPQQNSFGPNDWIVVNLQINGYQGGDVKWTAHKPDGTTNSGTLSSFQASKQTHSISRTAFDGQFGEWTLDYTYKDVTKTIKVPVESITLDIIPDKPIYNSGDKMFVKFTTSYYEPLASKAEDYFIEILDSNGTPIKQFTKIRVKASQPVLYHEFIADEILKYNPFGKYKIHLQYYNVEKEVPIEFQARDTKSSTFLGAEKKLYKSSEFVQLQFIVSKITNPSATITVTSPSGNVFTKEVAISQSLSRIILDSIPLTDRGTYHVQIEYAGQKKDTSFDVETDDSSSNNLMGITMTLNKQSFRPGESIVADIKSSRTTSGPLSYWMEGPGNKKTQGYLIQFDSPGLSLPYTIPKDIELGPWKFVIQYGDVHVSSLLVISGSPFSQSEQILKETYTGPKILMSVNDVVGSFNVPKSVSINSDSIFVLDSGNSEIKQFDKNGRLVKSWGAFGSSDGQLKNPTSIFVDDSFVYVADTGNSRIVVFDKNGEFVKSWGKSDIAEFSLSSPTSVAKDNSGMLYVSDKNMGEIKKFDSNGNYLSSIKYVDTAAAKFTSADSIAIDKNQNLYILVSSDNRILHYKTDGTFVSSFGTSGQDDGKLQNPTSIGLDSQGNIYVSDAGNSRIQVFDSNGKFLKKWGAKGNDNGNFNQISGISLDIENNVFAIDSQNKQLQKFQAVVVSSNIVIPDWLRNNAMWWTEGKLPDSEFASGIKYMIEKKLIMIPNLAQSDGSTEEKIPEWIKNNAKWWSEGKLSDQDFANGIEFMVKKGIIRV